MDEDDWLAQRFEEHRPHLRAVAQRMLGSTAEADDAVQEAWIRLSRADSAAVENLGGWLTTVVSRVSLDKLRSRAAKGEIPADDALAEQAVRPSPGIDPEVEAELAESIGAALLVVLDTLSPSERLAFVLHDLFAVPFEQIGEVLGRSASATKQLAHRARSKVRGGSAEAAADPARQRQVVDAFLAASRSGDFEALVALLDPDIELLADPAAAQMGSPERLSGAAAVAQMFSGRALGAVPADIDGNIGMAWAVGDHTKVAWDFTIIGDRVVHIEMVADPAMLAALSLTPLA